MADTTIGAKLTLDASEANKSVKSFREELKQAQFAAVDIGNKFGTTSKEAAEAAKKVALLKGQIGDTKNLIDAFNPDTKFRAFGAALNTVVGGFTAIQGAMGLIGVESADVQKALLKVQSALAFSQGLSQLQEGIQSFKSLSAVIQQTTIFQKANNAATAAAAVVMKLFGASVETTSIGFKVLKGAIAATGIGLLLILVTEAVSAITSWINSTDSAEKANKRLAASVDQVSNSLNKNIKQIELDTAKRLALAKKAGASEEELQKIRTIGAAKEIAQLVDAYNQKRDLYNKALADGKVTDEELNKLRSDAEKAQQEYIDRSNQREVDRLNFEASQAEKSRSQLKADLEKRLALQKEADKKLREEALKGLKDQSDRGIRDMGKGLNIERPKSPEEIELEARMTANKTFFKEKGELISLDIANEKAHTFEIESNSRIRKAAAEEEANARISAAQAIGNTLGALADLVGKQTAAGKVLAIAQATINTFLGATEVLRAKTVIPEPFGTIVKIANVAAIIATGISAIRNISKAQVPGGGGGAGNIPSAVAPLQPVAPGATSTQLNQQSLNAIGNATNRAFVLESDINSNEERTRRLNRAARIG